MSETKVITDSTLQETLVFNNYVEQGLTPQQTWLKLNGLLYSDENVKEKEPEWTAKTTDCQESKFWKGSSGSIFYCNATDPTTYYMDGNYGEHIRTCKECRDKVIKKQFGTEYCNENKQKWTAKTTIAPFTTSRIKPGIQICACDGNVKCMEHDQKWTAKTTCAPFTTINNDLLYNCTCKGDGNENCLKRKELLKKPIFICQCFGDQWCDKCWNIHNLTCLQAMEKMKKHNYATGVQVNRLSEYEKFQKLDKKEMAKEILSEYRKRKASLLEMFEPVHFLIQISNYDNENKDSTMKRHKELEKELRLFDYKYLEKSF